MQSTRSRKVLLPFILDDVDEGGASLVSNVEVTRGKNRTLLNLTPSSVITCGADLENLNSTMTKTTMGRRNLLLYRSIV